jgi:hypothetical protein
MCAGVQRRRTRSAESWIGKGCVLPAFAAGFGPANVTSGLPKYVHSSAVPVSTVQTSGSPIPVAFTAFSVADAPVVLVYADVRVVPTVGTMTDLTVVIL